ncbi:MAG: hypothetical protein WCE90_11865 [Candidatus Zixiibacteriota bacterium]
MITRFFQIGICLMMLSLAVFSMAHGSTFIENKTQPLSFRQSLATDDFEQSQRVLRLAHSPFLAYQADSTKEKEGVDVYGFKGKSLKRAFLYSLIVPGSGEFYAGSRIKPALFLGLDVTMWALYFNYHGKGKNKEKEYRVFADSSWSEGFYDQWLHDNFNGRDGQPIQSDTEAYWDKKQQDYVYFSHHLPNSKTQQYYEMIGKYEQFSWGWEDYSDATATSAKREHYLEMRHTSNELLNKAKYSVMVSLANHVLSAFDAALTVKKYNKKGERFGQIELRIRLTEGNQEVVPRLSVSMRF